MLPLDVTLTLVDKELLTFAALLAAFKPCEKLLPAPCVWVVLQAWSTHCGGGSPSKVPVCPCPLSS